MYYLYLHCFISELKLLLYDWIVLFVLLNTFLKKNFFRAFIAQFVMVHYTMLGLAPAFLGSLIVYYGTKMIALITESSERAASKSNSAGAAGR